MQLATKPKMERLDDSAARVLVAFVVVEFWVELNTSWRARCSLAYFRSLADIVAVEVVFAFIAPTVWWLLSPQPQPNKWIEASFNTSKPLE